MKYLIGFIVLAAVFGGGYYLTTKDAAAPQNGEHMMENGSMMEDKKMMGTSTEMMGDLEAENSGMMGSEGMGMEVKAGVDMQMGMKKEVTVTYNGSSFSPASVEIKVGDTVTFVNDSDNKMWVASNNHPTHTLYSEFDQDASVGKGKSYQFTFTKAGSWKYHNHLSANHGGTIVVK